MSVAQRSARLIPTAVAAAPPRLAASGQLDMESRGYKRPFDIALSSLLLIATAPLVGLIALIVKLSSPGPVLFRQERIGRDGTTFTMFKFRTMYADVDSATHHEYFQQYMKGESAPGEAADVFKLRNDPRITPAGRFLRRLGLDELPQLVHVLGGDMSLVGPRPPLAYEVAHYEPRHLGRLRVKPGVTGLWQVWGRDRVNFEAMVDMDLAYVERMSIWLDLKIVLWTVPSLVWSGLTK